MDTFKKKMVLFLFVVHMVFIPLFLVYADDGIVSCGRSGQASCTICDLISGVFTVVKFIVKLIGVVGVVIITVAGVMYMVSAGNTQMTSMAKAAITNTLIGVVVVLVAFMSITFILNNIFQNKSSQLSVEKGGLSGLAGNMWTFNCTAQPSGSASQ